MCSRRVVSNGILVFAVLSLAGLARGGEAVFSPLDRASDLDLSGGLVYAINFGNNGNPQFGDFIFLQDQDYPHVTLSITAEGVGSTWEGPNANTGDPSLDVLLSGLVWTNSGGRCTTAVAAGGLTVGVGYRLQLIFYDVDASHGRTVRIVVEGETIMDNFNMAAAQGGISGRGGSVVKYVFTAADPILNIEVTPIITDGSLASGLSGLILTELLASPDFNGDYRIDIEDLVLLIEHWGQDSPLFDLAPPPTGDGIVDRQDLEALMGHWGEELPDRRLAARWRLDETEGAIAYDSTGVHDANLIGTPTWQPAGGQVKGALQLDGAEDYVTSKFVLKPGSDSFSVFAWVKGGGPGQVILSQRDLSTTRGASWLGCDPRTGCLMTAVTNVHRVGVGPLVSLAEVSDGAWHQIGLVYDGGCRSLYLDGIEVARDPTSISPLTGTQAGLNLGAGKNLELGSFWAGLVDDVRIYGTAVIP
ncbi:MAG: hypothetical protein KBE04_06750 [Phycisphaerae bacterium]|nr:hypothetical protein [Phycisphaerae bacterium]